VRYGPRSTWIAGQAKRRGAKQKLGEFAAFVGFVRRRRPQVIAEIGSLWGGTLWAWKRIRPDAVVIGIDLEGGRFGTKGASVKVPAGVHLIEGDSHETTTLRRLETLLGARKVDLLFIDGDHTYGGVRRDFEMYAPLVRPGGIVAFHDVLRHSQPDCEVNRFWSEIKEHYPTRTFLDERDVGPRGVWGGIGVLEV
jgi:predicted O-methyltransferase YrrM